VSSPVPLPEEIHLQPGQVFDPDPTFEGEPGERSRLAAPRDLAVGRARRAETKVVKWLRTGGLVDAHCSATAAVGKPSAFALLHAAASNDQLAGDGEGAAGASTCRTAAATPRS
jgi:hypothetical protein